MRNFRFHPCAREATKGYKLVISEIAIETFNMGQNKFAAQFIQSQKNVANYLQRTSANEGYLVAKTVRTGREHIIELPPPPSTQMPPTPTTRGVKTIAKRRLKLAVSLKKGYAALYDQCLQEVKDKLEATDNNWASIQRDQLLHKLINKIQRICVGFDNYKQEVFNPMQALKTLFLYLQSNKETVEQYGQNFRMLWEMVEAFGGSPGIREGMIDALLMDNTQVAKVGSPTTSEKKKVQEDAMESVKVALLISGADKTRFGKLKDELANNYLLETDQYPDTFKKARCILGYYQSTKASRPYQGDGTESSLKFIQKGSRGHGHRDRGGGAE